jgi:hypothetical protein
MTIDRATAIADMERVLAERSDLSGTAAVTQRAAAMKACIHRWAPAGSPYRRDADSVNMMPLTNKTTPVKVMVGLLQALLDDYRADRVGTFEEMAHAVVFSDLLGEAQDLLDDRPPHLLAAAVVSGAALEAHLRRLASKLGIAISKGSGRPKEASMLNDDIKTAGAYSTAEWRQLQVWIDLRNEAAHGKPEFQNRTSAEIRAFRDGVAQFVSRHPA